MIFYEKEGGRGELRRPASDLDLDTDIDLTVKTGAGEL